MISRKYDDTVTLVKKEGDKLLTNTIQDCTGTLEQVRKDRDMNGGRTPMGYKAATIPQVMLHKWGSEDFPQNPLCYLQGLHNQIPELAKKLAVRLNSNEFREFRIWDGQVAASDMLKEGNKFG